MMNLISITLWLQKILSLQAFSLEKESKFPHKLFI